MLFRSLSIDIKNLGSGLDTLVSQLDLIKQYQTLKFEIQFGKGFKTDVKLAELEITQLGYAQEAANSEWEKARKKYDDATSALSQYSSTQVENAIFTGESGKQTNKFADAVAKLGDLTQANSSDLSGFNEEQKAYVKNAIDAGKKVIELRDKYGEYYDKIGLAKLKLQALTDAERRKIGRAHV